VSPTSPSFRGGAQRRTPESITPVSEKRRNRGHGFRNSLRSAGMTPESIKSAELALLPAFPIEILRREPALEGGLAGGPFAVEHGEPGGVAVAPLVDHVLAEDALE